jgi:hypothetical protein
MTVATNMAAVARLENPFRLSSFGDQVLLRNKRLCRKEKTNAKITTDAEKSTTNTPVIELVDEPHTASEEDAP